MDAVDETGEPVDGAAGEQTMATCRMNGDSALTS
jgi:hypothetical protein